jgi:DNA-binding CsgD family transcriptional regulator
MTEAPTPDLPRGAGGPLRRAAGRDSSLTPTAVVLEPDPLVRLLVVPAIIALGFAVDDDPRRPDGHIAGPRASRDRSCADRVIPLALHLPAAVFVPLDRVDDCRRAGVAARGAAAPGGTAPLVIGYSAGPAALLAGHRVHGCADVVLWLQAVAGRPGFSHLPATDAVTTAGLTAREADVLVLLLRGLTTQAIAARLCVSVSTARSHCRAVLSKLGAGDRRVLRARLLAGPSGPPIALPVVAGPRFA